MQQQRQQPGSAPPSPPSLIQRPAAPTPTPASSASSAVPVLCVFGCVSLDDEDEPMVGCDNNECRHGAWFHFKCVGVRKVPPKDSKWSCPGCIAETKQRSAAGDEKMPEGSDNDVDNGNDGSSTDNSTGDDAATAGAARARCSSSMGSRGSDQSSDGRSSLVSATATSTMASSRRRRKRIKLHALLNRRTNKGVLEYMVQSTAVGEISTPVGEDTWFTVHELGRLTLADGVPAIDTLIKNIDRAIDATPENYEICDVSIAPTANFKSSGKEKLLKPIRGVAPLAPPTAAEMQRVGGVIIQQDPGQAKVTKVVAPFRSDAEERRTTFLVGTFITIRWGGDKHWYAGVIDEYNQQNGMHHVLYNDDSSSEWLTLNLRLTYRLHASKVESHPDRWGDDAQEKAAADAEVHIKLLTRKVTTSESNVRTSTERARKILKQAKADIDVAEACARKQCRAADATAASATTQAAEAKELFEEQQEETNVMQIFSGRQTDAIDRLKALALQAGLDPQLVATAAELRPTKPP